MCQPQIFSKENPEAKSIGLLVLPPGKDAQLTL
jgi:hypothetical protein